MAANSFAGLPTEGRDLSGDSGPKNIVSSAVNPFVPPDRFDDKRRYSARSTILRYTVTSHVDLRLIPCPRASIRASRARSWQCADRVSPRHRVPSCFHPLRTDEALKPPSSRNLAVYFDSSRTTTTEQLAWCTQYSLTDPSNISVSALCPFDPTTRRSAPCAASTRT